MEVVPVLARVAEIFLAIIPDFPIPVSTTLPLQFLSKLNALSTSSGLSCSATFLMASASWFNSSRIRSRVDIIYFS